MKKLTNWLTLLQIFKFEYSYFRNSLSEARPLFRLIPSGNNFDSLVT